MASIKERVFGGEGIKTIVGAGFFWAWLDALFMSAFFIDPVFRGPLSEMGVVLAFGCNAIFLTLILAQQNKARALLSNRTSSLVLALAGVAGSLLYFFAGTGAGWPVLIAGSILCGVFMASFGASWGIVFCHDGARSAMPYVTGAFAFAAVVDLILLFMIPQATAMFFALTPVASGIMFFLLDPARRAPSPDKNLQPPRRGIRSFLRRYLGVSLTIIVSMVLVKVGFGYLQHMISYSVEAMSHPFGKEGIDFELIRGVFAWVIFALLLFKPSVSSVLYRVGFLIMVAGVMAMPFFSESSQFIVPKIAIVGGYTVFDIFIWVAFCHVAHTQSHDPLKTIVAMRLVSTTCVVAGTMLGIAVMGYGEHIDFSSSPETTVIGYFIVIATVLLLSADDVRVLFRSAQPPSKEELAIQNEETLTTRAEALFNTSGLTAREKEIATLLVQGRTQPWIAEALSISDNTVKTHVQHIYQKIDVHDRQQLIDKVLCSLSPEPYDSRPA